MKIFVDENIPLREWKAESVTNFSILNLVSEGILECSFKKRLRYSTFIGPFPVDHNRNFAYSVVRDFAEQNGISLKHEDECSIAIKTSIETPISTDYATDFIFPPGVGHLPKAKRC